MNIFFSIDASADCALYAAINSIIQNTNTPTALTFNILVGSNQSRYETQLREYFQNINFSVKEFSQATYPQEYGFLQDYLAAIVRRANDTNGVYFAHKNLMNFARIFLPEIFPKVAKALYLDTDLIVQADIFHLYNTELTAQYPCASSLNRRPARLPQLPELNLPFDSRAKTFNAGVYLFDVGYWRKHNLTELCRKILALTLEKKMTSMGTQPLLNRIFQGKTLNIDRRWNTSKVGYQHPPKSITETTLNNAYIIHWSGPRKPWLANGTFKHYWERYRLDLPSLKLTE